MATASPVAAGVRLAGFCHALSLGSPCSISSSTSQRYRSRRVTGDTWGIRASAPTGMNWGLYEVKSLHENVTFNISLGFFPSVKYHPKEFGDTLNEAVKRCVCFRCNRTAVLL